MRNYTIAVVSAGLSQPSTTRLLADQLTAATVANLADAQPGARVRAEHTELRELAHPLMDNLLTGFPAPSLATSDDRRGRAGQRDPRNRHDARG